MDYKELDAWKKCRILVSTIYTLSKNFPKEEMFGLTNQIRRAAVSVLSNIAEGNGRNSDKELLQFYHYSRGSLFEIESQLYVALDQLYISELQFGNAIQQVSDCIKLIQGMINYLNSKK